MVQLKRNKLIGKMRDSKFWKVYVGTAIVLGLMLLVFVVGLAFR